MTHDQFSANALCSSHLHFQRRTLLRGIGGSLFLSPLAWSLARAAEENPQQRPKSIIMLWLEGGPSQLETFDPHPGTKIGGDVTAIDTTAQGIQISNLLPHTAEQMHHIGLLRAVTSKEGDHQRAIYNIKTGYRPDPTLIHPSVGAIVCHESSSGADIPRHVSILPGQEPARGGYLGGRYDAFKIYDPASRVPDVSANVAETRLTSRLADLREIAETEFARGRLRNVGDARTQHPSATAAAEKMMSSEQLDAFDVSKESASDRTAFGDTPFGRGCLAAARLIEVGVRCVEVTLGGWDSHINNHALHVSGCATLDPALAALIKRLDERDLLEHTLVVCGGEFGRTPTINAAEGRDHWPHGFSMALAGCGIRGGVAHGATSPRPELDGDKARAALENEVQVADVHATILKAIGMPWNQENLTPIGRPMRYSEGTPIKSLVSAGV